MQGITLTHVHTIKLRDDHGSNTFEPIHNRQIGTIKNQDNLNLTHENASLIAIKFVVLMQATFALNTYISLTQLDILASFNH